jgi:hypothetical protein
MTNNQARKPNLISGQAQLRIWRVNTETLGLLGDLTICLLLMATVAGLGAVLTLTSGMGA